MNILPGLAANGVFWAVVTAWFLAQLLKVIFELLSGRKMNLSRFVGSGGMPSSHTAFVIALATAVARKNGLDSSEFAISMALALIVMYDATGVRRAAGQQAKLLNKMIENWNENDPVVFEKKLKELIGHTPLEVFAGAALGFIVGLFAQL